METTQGHQQAAPGAFTAFARFVVCGGGLGLASSLAVAALAGHLPWVLANALITAASTLLATELHARFTFGAGRRATWRQHTQSAGSALAAYATTSVAMLALQYLVATPGALLEQAVYLTASALAGLGRFVVLRLLVFARTEAASPASVPTAPAAAADVRTTPVRTAPARTAPTRTASVRTAPVRTAPARTTPVRVPVAVRAAALVRVPAAADPERLCRAA
ncbi:hypothetical protein [Streptomyces sp. NPDC054784]